MDDELIGIINLRKMLPILTKPNLSLKDIIKATRPGYFIPETTTLNIQLSKFNKHKRHMALIVDEYGNLQGLLTLEDLLEEIVGKFTTDNREKIFNTIKTHKDGSITFDASEFIRDVNKTYQFDLPTDGPKTLNGLIQEELETLPAEGTCLKIGNYTIEVVETSNHAIEQIKLKEIDPSLRFK